MLIDEALRNGELLTFDEWIKWQNATKANSVREKMRKNSTIESAQFNRGPVLSCRGNCTDDSGNDISGIVNEILDNGESSHHDELIGKQNTVKKHEEQMRKPSERDDVVQGSWDLNPGPAPVCSNSTFCMDATHGGANKPGDSTERQSQIVTERRFGVRSRLDGGSTSWTIRRSATYTCDWFTRDQWRRWAGTGSSSEQPAAERAWRRAGCAATSTTIYRLITRPSASKSTSIASSWRWTTVLWRISSGSYPAAVVTENSQFIGWPIEGSAKEWRADLHVLTLNYSINDSKNNIDTKIYLRLACL